MVSGHSIPVRQSTISTGPEDLVKAIIDTNRYADHACILDLSVKQSGLKV